MYGTGLIIKAAHAVFQPFGDGLEIFMILQETVARKGVLQRRRESLWRDS